MVHDNLENKQIVEEYKKRFAQILEFTMSKGGNIVGEADNEEPKGEEEMPMGDESDEGMDAMSQDPSMDAQGGGEIGAMPQEDPNMAPQGSEDMPMGGDGEDVTSGFNPQEGPNMSAGGDTMQPDDEVVDITELTDAQEETQEEIEQFDEKFTKAISAIKSLEDLIKNNDSKIEDLEVELKKRNPTPMEKMNNRRTISYPFNVSPEDYWKEKEAEGVYSTEDDNNGKDSEQYTITAGDINNANDFKAISDTLSNDFLYNQTLEKLLKM